MFSEWVGVISGGGGGGDLRVGGGVISEWGGVSGWLEGSSVRSRGDRIIIKRKIAERLSDNLINVTFM